MKKPPKNPKSKISEAKNLSLKPPPKTPRASSTPPPPAAGKKEEN